MRHGIWRYLSSLIFGKYLIVTNTVSSGAFMCLGDVLLQRVEGYLAGHDAHNWSRAGNMALVGFCLGPIQHEVYRHLELRWPERSGRAIAKKVAADQALNSPFSIVFFFITLSYLEGRPLEEGLRELRSKFAQCYLVDCCIWIPCQLVNFYFVRPPYRLLFINIITIFYNSFLSFMKYGYTK